MGALVRLVFVLLILAVLGAFFMGYRVKDGRVIDPNGAVATPGHVDTARAREAGATIGDKVAVGANAAQHALSNAALTGKIKAKMTLDDTLKGASVSVETTDAGAAVDARD
jgi:hypothetical protein